MISLFIETAGWIGAALILGSYVLVSTGRLEGRSRTFQWMNVAGAAGFVVNSGAHGAIPSTSLNVVWLGSVWLRCGRCGAAGAAPELGLGRGGRVPVAGRKPLPRDQCRRSQAEQDQHARLWHIDRRSAAAAAAAAAGAAARTGACA